LLFATVKEFSKSVNSWWIYCKQFDTTFFSETHCSNCKWCSTKVTMQTSLFQQ